MVGSFYVIFLGTECSCRYLLRLVPVWAVLQSRNQTWVFFCKLSLSFLFLRLKDLSEIPLSYFSWDPTPFLLKDCQSRELGRYKKCRWLTSMEYSSVTGTQYTKFNIKSATSLINIFIPNFLWATIWSFIHTFNKLPGTQNRCVRVQG